ncbi:hypothetical protein O181_061271 [Austropuccinia psidii MF-1]|uniref:Phosphatidylethanolamine-binding protein n=1 Tax=Austropuccinia psidii MF-1 TaxID=1389203 RepID=A0A9Q3EMG4_9BASI|nr:hypothetical protein [Austropuccinia psidii MF-1]
MSSVHLKISSALISLAAIVFTLQSSVVSQATSDLLSNVVAQYNNLSLASPYPDGFGIQLKASAILNVAYPSGVIQLGHPYSASDVASLPKIALQTGSDSTTFKAPNAFTLMLADANALGNPDKQGNYRHYLENGATFGDPDSNGTMTLNSGSGTVVTSYAGPGPLPNEGPHRYAWMLFVQPSAFQAPSNLSSAGVGPGHWYVNDYVSSTHLGDLVAASFFTVENGHASFTPKPTAVPSSNNSNGTKTSVPVTGAPKASAQSADAGRLAQMNFASLVKSIVTGLGTIIRILDVSVYQSSQQLILTME